MGNMEGQNPPTMADTINEHDVQAGMPGMAKERICPLMNYGNKYKLTITLEIIDPDKK